MRTFFTLSFVFSCLLMVQGQGKAASICDAAVGNLVANCGFENPGAGPGEFASWTLSGNDVPGDLDNLYGVEGTDPIDSIAPNSGDNQAFFADLVANATTLSQAITTNPGDTYAISFYLAQDTIPGTSLCAGVPCSNSFTAMFDGDTLIASSTIPFQGYTQYSFSETAADASSSLNFVFGNDLGEFLVDDVVVTDTTAAPATPEPSAWLLMLAACAITGVAGVKKFRRSVV
jgi:hypothetical protein